MATDKKPTEGAGAGTPEPPAPQGAAMWTTPIVLKRSKGKRKKRKKYSRGTKGWQRLGLGFADAAYRVANGISDGSNRFVKRSKRSEKKKRDGMSRDFFSNFSRGLGKGLSESSKAPRALSRRVSTRRTWKAFRVVTPF